MSGQNLLAYSEALAAGWSSSASDAGYVVQGQHAADARVTIDSDGTTTTEIDGAVSWQGSGELAALAAVDVSALTTVRMSVLFSPHQAEGGSYEVAIGLRNGATDYEIAAVTAKGSRRVWGDLDVADVTEEHRTAMVAYVTVTPPDEDYRWAAERIAVWDVVTYGDLPVETAGAAVTRTDDAKVTGAVVVCRECRDPRLELLPDEPTAPYDPGTVVEDLVVE